MTPEAVTRTLAAAADAARLVFEAMSAYFASVDHWITALSTIASLLLSLVAFTLVWRQRNLQLQSLRVQLMTPAREWGRLAVETLARCRIFVEAPTMAEPEKAAAQAKECEALRIALSTAIDLGRLHFPNWRTESYGAHKELAFRGYRPPILDAMVFCHHVLDEYGPADFPSAKAATIFDHARRIVISELRRYSTDDIALSGLKAKKPRSPEKDDGFVHVQSLAAEIHQAFPALFARHHYDTWLEGVSHHEFSQPARRRARARLKNITSRAESPAA